MGGRPEDPRRKSATKKQADRAERGKRWGIEDEDACLQQATGGMPKKGESAKVQRQPDSDCKKNMRVGN